MLGARRSLKCLHFFFSNSLKFTCYCFNELIIKEIVINSTQTPFLVVDFYFVHWQNINWRERLDNNWRTRDLVMNEMFLKQNHGLVLFFSANEWNLGHDLLLVNCWFVSTKRTPLVIMSSIVDCVSFFIIPNMLNKFLEWLGEFKAVLEMSFQKLETKIW